MGKYPGGMSNYWGFKDSITAWVFKKCLNVSPTNRDLSVPFLVI